MLSWIMPWSCFLGRAIGRCSPWRLQRIAGALVAAVLLLLTGVAEARINGLTGNGCSGCHASNEGPPEIILSIPALAPGQRAALSLTIRANGIVGGGPPIAMGAAFANKFLKSKRVAVAFFGDGASNEGSFHEAVNMAALYKLPCVFVC